MVKFMTGIRQCFNLNRPELQPRAAVPQSPSASTVSFGIGKREKNMEWMYWKCLCAANTEGFFISSFEPLIWFKRMFAPKPKHFVSRVTVCKCSCSTSQPDIWFSRRSNTCENWQRVLGIKLEWLPIIWKWNCSANRLGGRFRWLNGCVVYAPAPWAPRSVSRKC